MMAKILLVLLVFLTHFNLAKSQNVYGDLNFICNNQSISTGAPIETEYDNILTSCYWQPLTSYIEFYQILIESGTTFTFKITPNAQVDYDFASWLNPNPADLGYPDRSSQNNPSTTNIYDIGLSLTELNQLCESGGSTGYPEPGFVRYYEVQPGDVIIIAVDRWAEDDQGYTLNFGGNAELSCTFTYSLCDEGGDGEEDFDLNQIALNIQQTRYPEYNISFYDTQSNAENGTSVGQLTGNYTAYTTNNPNIIYARMEAQNGNFIEAVEIKLNVNGYPEIDEIPTLYYCGSSSDDIGLFNLNDAFDNIIEDPENYLIKFYRTEQGAQNENINDEITIPSSYISGSDSVYVRIKNLYGCQIIKELKLIVSVNLTLQQIELPLICIAENTDILNLENYRETLTNQDFASYQFEYYLNQSDALNGNVANSIPNPDNFPVNAGTTYTVYVRIIMGANCPPVISSITFTVGLTPNLTIESPQTVCFGESLSLSVETEPENTVHWHDSSTGTTPIFTGNPFVTPNLTTNTTYWIESESTEGCKSERISVEITVNLLPDFTYDTPPVICTGSIIEIEVTTDATNTVNWYDSSTGTIPIFVGNPFTTPDLTVTTSYWVEVVNEENCASERQEIEVEVSDEIIPQFTQIEPVCFGEAFELDNESINGITGTWLPVIDNTQTTEYTFTPDEGQCSTQNLTMTVVVVPIPELILPDPIETCFGETATITISTTGENVNWYENEIDTTPFFTGLIFSDEFTETTTFWLEAIDGSCFSEKMPFTIVVNSLPTIQAGTSGPVCEGNEAELSVITNGQIVNWYDSETATIPIFIGNPFITPNLNQTTIYYAEAISSNNCASERIPVTATISEEIIPDFNFELQYCLNSEEIILPTTDENGLNGTWFPPTIVTSNLGTEIYTFTPDLECAVTIFKTISIVEIIAPEFDELIQNYCLNATPEILPMASNNGISGTWFPAQINTSLQGTTTYIFTPNDGQCSEEFELSVTVYPHPDMDLEEELLICQSDSFTYSAPDGFDSYEWKNESNQIISQTREVTFTQEGIYTLTVEINGIPCDLSRNIEVKFSTPPTILEIKTTENSITVYASGGNPLEYSMNQVFWQSSPTFTNLQPGIFNVYVRDAKGCSTTAKQAGILGVPNFISPNGDGYNDVWELRGLEVYPNTRLQIFDRYGKIFVDKIIENSFIWDGKYNSQPLPSGSYWYIITLESGEKINGHITIKT